MQQQKADITIPCFHHGGLYAVLFSASKAFEEVKDIYNNYPKVANQDIIMTAAVQPIH